MTEPEIIINGVTLTPGQAMTLRVALTSADWDCGDDEHGVRMRQAYTARAREVLDVMLTPQRR